MTRPLALVAALITVGCAPKLVLSEVLPAASGLQLPDWTAPWNGDTLVVGTAAVKGMEVVDRPSRARAVVRVRYRWTLTPLGADYLDSLGCGRKQLTIETAEQPLCGYAGGTYARKVQFEWDPQIRAWRATGVVSPEQPG